MVTVLVVLAAFVALLAATVGGIALATRNPRLTARLQRAEKERAELADLTGRLYRWSAKALDDPQRRVVYDEITAVIGADQTSAEHKLRELTRRDTTDE